MIALSLTDIKTAAGALFAKETFDSFLVKEINITTGHTFHIDGHIKRDFYNQEELEEMENREYAMWKELRPFCYFIIKGKKLPLGFHITLALDSEKVPGFIDKYKLDLRAENIDGLYLHFQYKDRSLKAITGTALNFFTLDKTLEHAWDDTIKACFKESGIPFE